MLFLGMEMTPEIKTELNRGYRFAIASDHAGLDLKTFLLEKLQARGSTAEVVDYGTYTADSVDYPDFAVDVCYAVLARSADRGILICGSGIGMSIAANRFAGIRCALVSSQDTARLSREHNNSNVIALGARLMSPEQAWQYLLEWITTPYIPNPRHDRRMEKLDQ